LYNEYINVKNKTGTFIAGQSFDSTQKVEEVLVPQPKILIDPETALESARRRFSTNYFNSNSSVP
jgi:hypothetical protein